MKPSLSGAALVAIGDELLEGRHPDLNSPLAARELLALGVATRSVSVQPDAVAPLAERLSELSHTCDLILTSGGLGPTLDDITRHAAARAAGRELIELPQVVANLETWFASLGREMPSTNRRQALVPQGARLLPNRFGTAPGFALELGASLLACLPGPPREFAGVLREELLPWLQAETTLPEGVARAEFYLFGLSESVFAEQVGIWMDRDANPLMGVSAKDAVLQVRLTALAEDPATAQRILGARAAELRERLGPYLFSEQTPDLAQVVGRRLVELGLTAATAESCTGGLVASRLTDVPGISAVFREGFVPYDNAAKIARLGVDPALLERCGAVSEEVALALAEGAARASGADLAVSTTGIAGPGGGSPEKPVGLVWFGLWSGGRLSALSRRFGALGRERVRQRATLTALQLLGRGAEELAAGGDSPSASSA